MMHWKKSWIYEKIDTFFTYIMRRNDGNARTSYACHDVESLQAYRLNLNICTTIDPVVVAQEDCFDASPLSEALIQSPGYYVVDGLTFDMREPGLYRFYRLPCVSEQRVVCSAGVESALSCFGYIWAYGLSDAGKTADENTRNATKRVLHLGCSDCAFLAASLFTSIGIQARVVAAYTFGPWGGQDDGHTLVELYADDSFGAMTNERWLLYDPSFHRLFMLQGKHLSLREVLENVNHPELMIVPLHGNVSPALWRCNGYDYGFWIAHRIMEEGALLEWYRRILNIGLIFKDGWFHYNADNVPESKRELMMKTYKPLHCDEFNRTFYALSRR